MDRKFISTVCESYLISHNIDKTTEELTEMIMDSLKEVRDEDMNLFFEMAQLSRFNQTKIIESYLNFELISPEKIQYINECIQNGLFDELNEEFKIDSDINKLLEESFLGIDIGLISIFTSLLQTLVTVFGTVLGTAYANLIPFGLLTVLFISRHELNKGILKVFYVFSKGFLNVAAWLKDKGSTWKYRYVLTFHNEEECYKKAGVNKDQLSVLIPWALNSKPDSIIPEVYTKQSHVLRDCYINNYISRMALISDFFFDCLKKAGYNLRTIDDDTIMKILGKTNLVPICDEYQKTLDEMLTSFDKIIEFFYKTSGERAAYKNKLTNEVLKYKTKRSELKDTYDREKRKEEVQRYKPYQKK